MLQFTENQVLIPHDIVDVKKIYLLIRFVLEAVLVLFVKSDNTMGCQTSVIVSTKMYTGERQNWQMHGFK
jgi:hypothetical protein